MMLLVLALAACDTPTPSPIHPGPSAQHVADADASHAFDRMFIDMMVPHHQGAVDMATIARTRGEHAEIKAMAEAIIKSQTAEIGTMQGWRAAWFEASAPSGMASHAMEMPGMAGMDQRQAVEALKTATPFDLAFLDAMIPHHEGALKMGQHAAEMGQHPELKDLAARIILDQRAEIEQMRAWRTLWYPAAGAAPASTH